MWDVCRRMTVGLAFAALLMACLFLFAASSPSIQPAQAQAPFQVAVGSVGPYSVTPTCVPAWDIVNSPNPSSSTNYLKAVDAASGNDVWAVGTYKVGSGSYGYMTLALHWNGVQWTQISSPNPNPNPSSGLNDFLAVEAISSNDVWAVGYTYSSGNGQLNLIEHWDGVQWSIVPSPNPGANTNRLTGISALSSNDIWAVGYYVGGSGNRTLVMHWNGSGWSVVPSPNIGPYNNELLEVDAISSSDVWAVGLYEDNGSPVPLTQHWDGVQWSVVSSPYPSGATHNFLYGVSAVASNDVWAVGFYQVQAGMASTLIEHWDGTQWSIVPSPNGEPPDFSELDGGGRILQ